MRTIITLHDLTVLKQSSTFTESFMDYLKTEFEALADSLNTDGCSLESFTLQPYGYMVVLEKDDSFKQIGYTPDESRLPSLPPEYVELINLVDPQVYRIGIMLDNDYMMLYYTERGVHNQSIEAWLDEQLDKGEPHHD